MKNKNNRWKKLWAPLVAVLILASFALAGCAAPVTPAENQQAAAQDKGGNLLLAVNPEIRISYDAQGLVTQVTARNRDAKAVLEGYDGKGKECTVVVEELLERIEAQGYFYVEEVEAEGCTITIEVEKGSYIPDEAFLSEIRTGVESYVKGLGNPVQLEVDGKEAQVAAPAGQALSLEEARKIAFEKAGVQDAQVVHEYLDKEDNEYEFEFVAGEKEYEVSVNASSGRVTDYDVDRAEQKPAAKPADSQQTASQPSGSVSQEEAKKVALDRAGISQAEFYKEYYDREDNEYKFEFVAGDTEYEVSVSAGSGKVTDYDAERAKGSSQPAPDRDDDRYDDDDDDDDRDDWDD